MLNLFKKKKSKNSNEMKEKRILSIMEKTGWTREEVIKNVDEARKNTGITYRDYEKYNFHKVPVEDQVEGYKALCEKKEKRRIQKEKDIAELMEKTGWSREKVVKNVEASKKKYSITYRDYNKYDLYKYSINKQEEEYKKLKNKKSEKDAKLAKNREKAIVATMEKTGWNYEEAKAKIMEARKRTGCAYKEYVTYKFWDLDEEVQNSLFLIKDSKAIARRWDTDKKIYRMLTNKELTNKEFSEYLKRPWCVNTKISENEFIDKFKNSKKVIYKPLDGNRGKGVEAFEIDESNAAEVYEKLKVLPEGVVEQYVIQHHSLSELAPASVNTLRIVSISSNKEPVTEDGSKMDIAYASLRIGGGTSIIDNFHGGGMVAVVDLETGKLVTDAADMDGNVFKKHPLTGVEIKGFTVPYFKEAISMVKEAQAKSKIDGYLGWDIAITEDGPVLIEINLRPGVVLLTTPYIAEKKGMKYLMEKYM